MAYNFQERQLLFLLLDHSCHSLLFENAGSNGYDKKTRESFLESMLYRHNINNPELRMLRATNPDMTSNSTAINNNKPLKESTSSVKSERRNSRSEKCSCSQFHCHRIELHDWKVMKVTNPAILEKRSQEVQRANETQELICGIFWNANLGFCEYQHGKEVENFASLWPTGSGHETLLAVGVEELGQKGAVWDLCNLLLVEGPVTLLNSLLDKSVVRVDALIDWDGGLLHLACVLQNMEAIQMLTQYGISHKIKDRSGNTADMVCFNTALRKQLPKRYQHQNKALGTVSPGLQDKEAIFRLAATPHSLYELQNKLQMFQFPVNDERNRDGDFLIHIACRTGICQLPLLLSLKKLQGADVNLCNLEGLTPLMIVARTGDSHLCDTLMCVFGADPNKQNSKTKKTALHYAAEANHVHVASCLIKRGADVNIEDNEHSRPDDALSVSDDCRQVIQFHRTQRSKSLAEKVREDTIYPVDLRPTDLTVVDNEGYTLLMIAAMSNRIHNLEVLLQVSTQTINAQHGETGSTALAFAAKAGDHLCCKELIRWDANPGIKDMEGHLALHHAVLNNHESVVDVFLQKFPSAYTGLFSALRMCRKATIHDKLNKAWEKRQDQIVLTVLRISAMEGNAEKLYCTLEEGDFVNAKSNLESQPAMFYAVENSHVEVLKLLLERGLDLKRRDVRSGNTVLHVVAQTGKTAMAKFLLGYCDATGNQSKGKVSLDVNAMNNDRKTPLQICAEKGYVKIVKLFIEKGATTAILNNQGSLFTSPEYEGARILIEACRNSHTEVVVKLVADKSKKALVQLAKEFLPRFDHNLRTKLGDTPLMVACRYGRLENVRFLLQSAVYANQLGWNDENSRSETSEADSVVTDLPPWKSHDGSREEMVTSLETSFGFGSNSMALDASAQFTRSLNPNDMVNTLRSYDTQSIASSRKVSSFLHAVERPKGLFIYHDSVVSHVCAVNLFDGNTPLHRCIEGGDHVEIVRALLDADSAVVNIQNDAGLSPVHMACLLGRKKTLELLLSVEGVDLGLVTLTGQLPEELTNNKALLKMIHQARATTLSDSGPRDRIETMTNLTESLHSYPSTRGGSTVNFGKIDDIFQSMKVEQSMKTNHAGGS